MASSMSSAIPDSFDLVPASLWLEDYSRLYVLFQQWRNEGVHDLRSFLTQDPHRLDQCRDGIRLLRVNQRTLSLYGASSFEALSSRLDEILRADTYDAFVTELEQLWNGQTRFESKTINYTLDGRRLDILLRGVILPEAEQPWDRVMVALEDISALEAAYQRTRASELYARGIFEQSPVSLWVENFQSIKRLLDEVREQGIVDFRTFIDVHPEFVQRCAAEIQVLDVNQHTLQLFKAGSKAELLDNLSLVFRDEMYNSFRSQLQDLWDGQLFQQREVLNYALDGSPLHIHLQLSVFPGHEENWDLVLLALTDITARKKAEAYLEFLGKHDALTKLKNRAFYMEEINRLDKKGIHPVSVIIIDLNNLKGVNDTLGHAAGDALLQRMGEVLGKLVESPGHAARIGGDEFAVVLPGVDTKEGEIMVAQLYDLLELNNQFYTGPKLQFSVGLATRSVKQRLDDVLRDADLAMYAQKRQFYEEQGAPQRRYNDKNS